MLLSANPGADIDHENAVVNLVQNTNKAFKDSLSNDTEYQYG
jgi:hypothetical protein